LGDIKIHSQSNQGSLTRSNEIDLVKGFLVFIMVLYHCSSIAEITSPELSVIRKSLNFVTFSFLIITGFLCGWHYVPQMTIISRKAVRKRLSVRALKIILIFLFSNILLYAFGIFDRTIQLNAISTLTDFCNLFLFPNGNLIAFEILLPIGLFLLLSPFILMQKPILSAAIFFTVVTVILGHYIGILSTVAFGGIGLIAGSIVQSTWARKYLTVFKENKLTYLAVFIVCSCTIMLLKYFNISFQFHIYYTFETILWFLGFLAITRLLDNKNLSDIFVFLGKYTLLGYMAQMLIIRLIYMFLTSASITGFYYYISNVLISTILLYIFLKIITLSRNHSTVFNSAYRFVFQ
jgi:hypothetical protein